MLQKLSIRNYALIDNAELEPDRGLSIITGETGAGKSIMLGALSLILGQRAETKYFFNQEKKCIIEGHFLLTGEALKPLFDENDLDFYQESILRREISTDGKSRAFINDTPVTLTVMKQIGEQLIDIHSQHATLEVSDPAFQLKVIDTLAGHQPLLDGYRSGYKTFRKLQQELIQLKDTLADARSRQDYEQFLFDELEAASLKAEEAEKLEAELQVLGNAETIKRALISAFQLLSDQEMSALDMLKETISQLQGITRFTPEYQVLDDRLRSVMIELRDIAQETSSLQENIVFNPGRIEEINSRLDLIYNLQQKHKVNNVPDLLLVREKLSGNLSKLLSGEEEIVLLEEKIRQLEASLRQQASALSANRSKAIQLAESKVAEILAQVGMPNARIRITQETAAGLNKDGRDEVNMLFTANSGQTPAPIGKVASGGELSRLMLALKSVMARHTALPTLIFDEIDTGISGETALQVGQVIGDLEANMQVICITHLPQIAARGKSHYFVYKNEENNRTTTGIRKLEPAERVQVIAEMLSGKDPGASAVSNARELLRTD